MISLTAKRHQSESANFNYISLGEKGETQPDCINYLNQIVFFTLSTYLIGKENQVCTQCRINHE